MWETCKDKIYWVAWSEMGDLKSMATRDLRDAGNQAEESHA